MCRAYQWRWPVALLCKAWKSYANLHAFDTAKPAIVAGLIWAAIAAAALKRFWAPMAPLRVAMGATPIFGDIVQALKSGDVAELYVALEATIMYVARQAQRAHPKRDRRTGRAQLGLQPLFGSDDVIEFAEAA